MNEIVERDKKNRSLYGAPDGQLNDYQKSHNRIYNLPIGQLQSGKVTHTLLPDGSASIDFVYTDAQEQQQTIHLDNAEEEDVTKNTKAGHTGFMRPEEDEIDYIKLKRGLDVRDSSRFRHRP